MSFAFMAIYTGDYLRDTRHLTPQKHGVYFMLLMHCWDSRGPVPLDEQEAAGIANCRSADEIESLRYILGKYFVLMDDGYYNQRMQKEIERAAAISHARSEAGFKGYQAKAKQLPSKSQARASTPTTTITPTTTPTTPKDNTLSSGKPDKAQSFSEESRRVLAYLNELSGREYRFVETNLKQIQARLDSGASEDDIRKVIAMKCKEWANTDYSKYLRPDTLFNKTKFEQYIGGIAVADKPNTSRKVAW